MLFWFCFAAAAVLSVVFLLRYSTQSPSLAKSMTKTAAVLLLALCAVVDDGPALLVAALAFGALGDLALSRDGQAAFLAGLGAFAISHLIYVALLIQSGAQVQANLPSILLVLAATAVATVLIPRAGGLRLPVLIYVGVILAMGLCALGLPATLWLATLAALLFMASDIVLGADRFVWGPHHRFAQSASYLIWMLYWLAQALFLLAFVAPMAA